MTIESEIENNFIHNLTKGRTLQSWLGLKRDETDNSLWKWIGTDIPAWYHNWKPGEPNNAGNENCVVIHQNGQWSDYNCKTRKFYFICEGV